MPVFLPTRACRLGHGIRCVRPRPSPPLRRGRLRPPARPVGSGEVGEVTRRINQMVMEVSAFRIRGVGMVVVIVVIVVVEVVVLLVGLALGIVITLVFVLVPIVYLVIASHSCC